MIREILFRGKRKDNGEWETGSLVMIFQGLSDEQVFITDKMTGVRIPVSPDTIGQYTGLTDKNGKKIFEGDIIDNHVKCDMLAVRGVIEWNERNGSWAHHLNTMNTSFCLYSAAAYEVIGNVHDNPELVKGVRGK